ncbi:MAG: gfo/Idh/MocA family oxidoreductase [Pyrinomonas sp.]|uniref:Gfo/Idh/MocA family protein n=1 Tax=Pyrinomonas sp. TaxID=2080306 RepID=UPI00331704CB
MSDTVRIGIIGTGFARTTQIPAFLACEGARVVAIASGHRANAERVAQTFGIPHVADRWQELIARDDVDLVSIVTPPSTHMEMALAALDAGKAVLCEKPMAMNADETRRMVERAERSGAFALVDHELRFLNGRRRMRDMVRDGAIGKVIHIKILFRNATRAHPDRPWNWWSDEKQGGGVLGAIGSHAVDSVRWLLGAEVKEICCSLATHIKERRDAQTGALRRVTSDTEALLLMRLAKTDLVEDATGLISLSVVEAGQQEHFTEIFGRRGALRIEERGELWRADLDANRWEQVPVEPDDLAPGLQDNGWSRGFTAFARAIVAALREGRRTVEEAATFADGHRVQLVLDAARRAHERGCWTSVDAP